MQCTGLLVDVNRNWQNGKLRLTFEINEDIPNAVNEINGVELLDITADKHKVKRSLDSNAYCWVLIQKIAEAVHSDKWSIYLQCLQRYSRAFTHVIVKENAVDAMKEVWRTCVDLGEVTVNGQTGRQLQLYYGSSSFDSKQMSVFIDGIVQECKELGIETMTPDQLERMKAAWQSD